MLVMKNFRSNINYLGRRYRFLIYNFKTRLLPKSGNLNSKLMRDCHPYLPLSYRRISPGAATIPTNYYSYLDKSGCYLWPASGLVKMYRKLSLLRPKNLEQMFY